MDLVIPAHVVPAVALAAAGLIAVTPAATAPLFDLQTPTVELTSLADDAALALAGDPGDIWAAVESSNGIVQLDFSDAMTALTGGDLANALSAVSSGVLTLLVSTPINVLAASSNVVLGTDVFTASGFLPVTAPTDFDDLSSNLNLAFLAVSAGLNLLSAGDWGNGLVGVTEGSLGVLAQATLGPVEILLGGL